MSEADHDRWFRAQVQAALAKPDPRFTPADEVRAWLTATTADRPPLAGADRPPG